MLYREVTAIHSQQLRGIYERYNLGIPLVSIIFGTGAVICAAVAVAQCNGK
jgi:hypothetical protein